MDGTYGKRSGPTVALALVLALGAGLTGCSPRRAPDDPAVRIESELMGGGVATSATVPLLDAVGLLQIQGTGNCSATLIAPRVMITAAHCVFPGAEGCDLQIGPATVIFSDTNGNPFPAGGAGTQKINVVGIAPHPDAYGARVAACANPVPAPAACPDVTLNPNAFTTASCALLKACWPNGVNAIPCLPACGPGLVKGVTCCTNQGASFQAVATMNFHPENDIALVFLESAPTGINPVPVLTQGWSSASDNIFNADPVVFNTWTAGKPLVTVAGYGTGTKAATTRDMGTMTLAGTQSSLGRGFTCNGTSLGSTTETVWSISTNAANQANLVPGDSGGPMFFGSGPVVAGVPSPSALPAGTGLTDQRYLAGVASETGLEVSLFQPDNAQWLVNSLKDFDSDGVLNENDNCVGVANSDQANCNADAETDRGGRVLGDACDPVPCPKAEAPFPLQPQPTHSCSVQLVTQTRNFVELTPVASHNSFNGVTQTDPSVATRFRFCQASSARGNTCALVDGQRGNAPFDVANPNGNPPNNWLPMTFSTLGPTEDLVIDYPSAVSDLTWSYTTDRARWITAGQIDAPPADTGVLGPFPSGLSGALGARGNTLLGSTSRAGNGVHVSPVQVGFPSGSAMARHYESLAPSIRTAQIGNCVAYDPFWRSKCPACAISLPRFPDCAACVLIRTPSIDWWQGRLIDPAVLIPGLRGRWGIVDTTGGFVLPPSTFSPALVGELSSALGVLVPRAEADATKFGTLLPTVTATAPIQGAFISLDATTVRGVVRASTLGFHLDGEAFATAGTGAETPLSVAIPDGAFANDLAVAALGGTLKIDDRSVVVTTAGAPAKVAAVLGATDVGVDAKIGPVWSSGNVELHDRARVDGAVVTEGSLVLHNGNVVTGTKSEHTSINALDLSWTTHIPATTQGSVMLEPDLPPFPLAPGSWGDVHVKSRRTLQLRSGTYYLDSLFVEPQAVLDIDNRTGPVYIYMRQGLTFRGKTAERNTALANMLFVANGGGSIPIEAPFRGTLVAPNAALTLATVGTTGHMGAFFARSVEVAPDVTVKLRPFVRPDCTDSGGCLGGWETAATSHVKTAALGIAARHGFAAVLTAKLSSLYVIGGRFNAGNALTGQIVRYRLDLGTTQTVTVPDYTPGDVLAAALNVADGSLWILDRVVTEGTSVRLTRVDPIGLRFRVAWEGPESGSFDGHFLASATDGGAILFQSSHTLGRYAAIRVQATPFVFEAESFQLLTDTTGVLAGLPIARSSGSIGYILERSDGRLDRVDAPATPGTAVTNLSPWL